MNYYKGSFLDYDKEGFDIVVGNPPYNLDGGIGGGKGGRSGLWKIFIYKSLNIINKLGYLLKVVPNTWVGNRNDFKKFKKYNLLYLNINKCSRYFKIDNTFSYFLLQKTTYKQFTIIESINSKEKINLINIDFLPLSSDVINNDLFKILNKIYKNGVFKFNNGNSYSINTNYISFNKDDNYKYPLFYSSDKKRKLLYSNIKFNGYGDIKLVSSYINDFDKKNINHFTEISINKGVGKQSGYYKMDNIEDCEKLKVFLNSKIVIFINNIYRNGRYANTVLKRLPLINLNLAEDDDKIFNYFNINNNERTFIENMITKIKKG